jgi:hypothetical protein
MHCVNFKFEAEVLKEETDLGFDNQNPNLEENIEEIEQDHVLSP